MKNDNSDDSQEEEKVPEKELSDVEEEEEEQIDSTVHDLGDIMIQADTKVNGSLNEKIGDIIDQQEDEQEIE